jgi:AcrR family transcriptional regulator
LDVCNALGLNLYWVDTIMPAMGRKAGVSPEETRQAVLDAALRTFAEAGYHGASTRSIGAAADLTIGAVHHHFGSKAELYSACAEEADARLGSLIERAMMAGDLAKAARVSVEALRDESISLAFRLVARKVWEDPEGEIEDRLRTHGGALQAGGSLLAKLTGVSELRARMRVQAAVFVLARFALSPVEERRFITGAKTEEAALTLLEDELVATLLHIVSV